MWRFACFNPPYTGYRFHFNFMNEEYTITSIYSVCTAAPDNDDDYRRACPPLESLESNRTIKILFHGSVGRQTTVIIIIIGKQMQSSGNPNQIVRRRIMIMCRERPSALTRGPDDDDDEEYGAVFDCKQLEKMVLADYSSSVAALVRGFKFRKVRVN